jgi:hypothetical protein
LRCVLYRQFEESGTMLAIVVGMAPSIRKDGDQASGLWAVGSYFPFGSFHVF